MNIKNAKKSKTRSMHKKQSATIEEPIKKAPKSPASVKNTKRNSRIVTHIMTETKSADKQKLKSPESLKSNKLGEKSKHLFDRKISAPVNKIKDKFEENNNTKLSENELSNLVNNKPNKKTNSKSNNEPLTNIREEYKPSGGSTIKVVCRIRPPNKAEKVIINIR